MNSLQLPKQKVQLKNMILKNPPPDKSITHRALLLSAIGRGVSKISNPLVSDDINATVTCLKKLVFPLNALKSKLS